ncbi:MAG: hypothetical protein E7626_01095 [Ruminococcaceae bacterium]|nr:hypothetical protein [Oscillospiraceae bacterium]
MYSRRFYSSFRAKNTPVIQTVSPKRAPDTAQPKASDTRPRWANDFSSENFTGGEVSYKEPRDFAPAVSIISDISPKEETKITLEPEAPAESVSEKMKNMTFEDMMLTWLMLMSSSGEYDDEILLILGLILMIGA